jgi:hypothetical protein
MLPTQEGNNDHVVSCLQARTPGHSFPLRLDDGKQERTRLLLVCRFARYKLADAFSIFSAEVSVLSISGE